MENPVYSKNSIEFVTVALEFCNFLEKTDERTRDEFTQTCVKLLPLLYLKACLLPDCEPEEIEENEKFVTEEVYEYIRNRIAGLLGDQDAYLEVFHSDMQYSDTPIAACLSENLADIYQDIKDFISVYRLGEEKSMLVALSNCRENFRHYWGQKLVNAQRPLHAICFTESPDDGTGNGKPMTDADDSSILAQRFEEWKDNVDTDEWNKWNE